MYHHPSSVQKYLFEYQYPKKSGKPLSWNHNRILPVVKGRRSSGVAPVGPGSPTQTYYQQQLRQWRLSESDGGEICPRSLLERRLSTISVSYKKGSHRQQHGCAMGDPMSIRNNHPQASYRYTGATLVNIITTGLNNPVENNIEGSAG